MGVRNLMIHARRSKIVVQNFVRGLQADRENVKTRIVKNQEHAKRTKTVVQIIAIPKRNVEAMKVVLGIHSNVAKKVVRIRNVVPG